jgi:hypothetical protein
MQLLSGTSRAQVNSETIIWIMFTMGLGVDDKGYSLDLP